MSAEISRRSLMKTSALGSLALASSAFTLPFSQMVRAAQAPVEEKAVWSSCTVNCGSRCLLRLHVKDDTVYWVESDTTGDDVYGNHQVRACLRGRSIRRRMNHPDRLKYPMKRVGKRGEGKFERISWDEALDTISDNLRRILKDYGNEAVHVLYGTGVDGGNITNSNVPYRLMNSCGGFLSRYGSYSTAQISAAMSYMFGANDGNSPDDIANTKLVVMFGNNPAETRMSGGGVTYYVEQARERSNARMIVIDPRYNDTAAGREDEWLPIRPGTDGALACAIAWVLITENMVDQPFLDKYCVGYDEKTLPANAPRNAHYKAYILGEGPDGIAKPTDYFGARKYREYAVVAENQPGHIDQIKQTNAGAVYRLIDQLGPVSRIDLSRLAQLAPASITKIVREMLEAHLVQELEIKEAGNRGRPAVGLVVETEAWHYLSLRISRGEIFLALRDLSSKLVVEESQELALKDDSPLLDRIISHIDQFFIRHQKKLERLTSIAITLPGIIDTENGIVHRMPFYEDVKEMPLGEALEQHTGVPVYIQHDISAWTMAEALFGASRGARDVIQVVIDHNVGAGVITDGHLLHAGSSSLVEIGHTQVDPYGKRCYCGNHGCLETIASVDSILELAQLRLNQSMSSMLHGQPLTVDSLCQAALRGDLLAKDIITGVGAHVGRILAIMVNLFNPQKILIGSPLSKAADILFPVISDSIRQQALPAYSQHISVESTQFSNQGTMAGAALVKDAMYNGSLLIRLLQG